MLIIFGCYWNDMDWLESSLKHIEYWAPDKLYLCEGCWDRKYPPRSTDGTREMLEKYGKGEIINNTREFDYRKNQITTYNEVLKRSGAKAGDWIMFMACDFFMFKKDIDIYRELMQSCEFDYPIFEILNFWDTTKKYYSKLSEMSLNLPWRLVDGFGWEPPCHLTKNGILYNNRKDVRSTKLDIKGFHYEGFRNGERIKQKYDVGTRESVITWKGGIKLKQRKDYAGKHPEFAVPVLREKGAL